MNNSLTPYELLLVSDANILLTKNRIIKSVSDFFGQLMEVYKDELGKKMKYEEVLLNGKISRGENYKGLPYVMLDFPRQFSKSNVFAIRTMFWWGNFFSITLHLAGEPQIKYLKGIQKAIDERVFNGWYLSVGDSEWEHHFESDNYSSIENEGADIISKPFLKLAKKIPLAKWDESERFLIENFRLLISVLED